MAAKELTKEVVDGISAEIGSFYYQVESRYWSKFATEAVLEKLALQDLFKELNRLKEQVLKSYSSVPAREKIAVATCNVHVMACRELLHWKRSILRREFFVAKHSNPWIDLFSYRLQREVFDHVVEMLTCTSTFGVNIQRHLNGNREDKEKVIEVVHKRKLERWFSGVNSYGEGFRRDIKGKGYTDVLVDTNKPFQIKYTYSSEVVQIKCHYGAWNTEGVPQFI